MDRGRQLYSFENTAVSECHDESKSPFGDGFRSLNVRVHS